MLLFCNHILFSFMLLGFTIRPTDNSKPKGSALSEENNMRLKVIWFIFLEQPKSHNRLKCVKEMLY